MKNLVFFLIFIFITGYAVTVALQKITSSESILFEKTYSYPDKITVKNKEGSTLRITLLGRNDSYLEFEKKDGSQFVYPISSLDKQSRELVMKYPETGIKEVSSYLSNGSIELHDAYKIQLAEQISRLEAEITRLDIQASATQSQTELRTLERKMESLEKEIAVLKGKIAARN